jgi:hypothetical protein
MTDTDVMPLPAPTFAGGTKAIPTTPVVQTKNLTMFNVTQEAAVARQAQLTDRLPPIAGEQRMAYAPVVQAPPERWAEARIPLD